MHTPSPSVLVIDDDPDILDLVKMFLEQAGFHTLATTDPEDAVRLMETDLSIKVVLADVSMPKLSGPEVIRRAFKVRDDVRVLFMSGGFAGVQFRQTDKFFRKPLPFDQVVKAIHSALKEMPAPSNWEGTERRRPPLPPIA